MLCQKLLDYNKTMVTPLELIYHSDPTGADPSKIGEFWSLGSMDLHPKVYNRYKCEKSNFC